MLNLWNNNTLNKEQTSFDYLKYNNKINYSSSQAALGDKYHKASRMS
jgi:hypothetical protein